MDSYNIKGTVLDHNNAPLSDVIVVIVAGTSTFPEIAAVSNDRGEFGFSNLEKGKFTLKAFYGEASKLVEVVVNEPNSETRIQFN